MKYLLGIDQGTTQTTAVVVNELGEMVEKNSAQLPARFPQPGWVEQDPLDIVRTVKEACAPLIAKYEIVAAGFDNQGETFVVWDADTGEPVTPAIVWQDTRGESVCRALAPGVDSGRLRQKTGLLLDSYFSAPKLKWVFEHYPELRERAHAGTLLFGTTETWVIWSLTDGKLHVTDPSTASRTLLFNVNSFEWDAELMDVFDVPRQMLPEVRPSAGWLGDVDFGNGKPLPLHALLVDQQAALFGQACFRASEMKCSFGTGSFLLMNIGDKPRLSDHGLLTTVGWNFDGHTAYAFDGGIFVTGSAVQWLRDQLKIISNASEIETLASQVDSAAHLYFVPAFSGLFAPYWRSDARGVIVGLSRFHTREHIARATLEAICYQTRDVLDAMTADSGKRLRVLRVDGGAVANDFLMQFQADLVGVRVERPEVIETTAAGAAYLAGVGVGVWKTGADVERVRRVDRVFEPAMSTPERRRLYEGWKAAVARVRSAPGPRAART